MSVFMIKKQEFPQGGQFAIKLPALTLSPGKKVGLIGGNGSGKSTLLKGLLTQEVMAQYPWTTEDVGYFAQEVATTSTVSGGEATLERLKGLVQQEVPLLLLDEPTNHLDEANRQWLRSTLRASKQRAVIVSHDRDFLNEVVDEIWELSDRELLVYPGNYQSYLEQKELAQVTQHKQYVAQQKAKAKVRQEMAQLTNWSAAAHKGASQQEFPKEFYRSKAKAMDKQRKSKERRLEQQLAKSEVAPVAPVQKVSFDFLGSQEKKGPLFLVEKLSQSYGSGPVLDKLSTTINYGDKVAITGPNGSGKSTFLRCLLDQVSYEGQIWRSPSAKIGYLSQNVLDLPAALTVKTYLADLAISSERQQSGRLLFAQLGFRQEQWHQVIGTLSMGERLKVKLLAQMLGGMSVLILDEPTNHLDLPSREGLEAVLSAYPGTIILVSHDSYFREKVCDRELTLGQMKEVDLVIREEEQEPADKHHQALTLGLRRDQLLSQLSVTAPTDPQYHQLDQAFQEVLKELKDLR